MTKEEILKKVLTFLAEQSIVDSAEISPDQPLSNTVLIDSLTVLETVMFLESEFGLQLDRADLDAIRSPESIVELILRKQAGN